MNLTKFFLPKTHVFQDNKFNKKILLIDHFPEPTIVVDGLIESGGLLTRIWRQGIQKLVPKSAEIKNILVLGLGGGSNTKLVSRLYPKSQITAIEIDPQMVQIANTFFSLDKVKNLKIVTADAIKYVQSLNSENYDLVLVDCFVGKNIPSNLQELSFIEKLHKHSTHLLINRIWYNEYHPETVFFLRKMSQKFCVIKTQTPTNIIIKLI